MDFVKGISYHLRGLLLAIKTPRLLMLGLIRLILVVLLTVLAAGFILYHHQEILKLIWVKPASTWLVWLWHVVSWLLAALLTGVAVILAYLASQLLFAVQRHDSRTAQRRRQQQDCHQAGYQWRGYVWVVHALLPSLHLPVKSSLSG